MSLFVPDYLVSAGALSTFHPGGVRFLLHGEHRSTAAIQAIGETSELAGQFDLEGGVNL